MNKCNSQLETCSWYATIRSQMFKTCSPRAKRGPVISTENAHAMKPLRRYAKLRENPGLTSHTCPEHHNCRMIQSTIRTAFGWMMTQLLQFNTPKFRSCFCTLTQIHGCPL